MKLEQLDREVVTSGAIGQVFEATVAASRKVFDMFADSTYANKEEAIVRELVANGIDAQRLNGKSHIPVQVILPTELDPMMIIKDCGPGMSTAFVTGPFMAFTDGSTKDSNDDDIGGFGIGSKSPLSYVDQYTLRVVHEGILSIYTLWRNERGIPVIALQAQTTTDEDSGVQISFPVETQDIPKFQEAAQTALQYFSPLPEVENGTLTGPDYSYVGDRWAMRQSAGPLGIIMGGVRYPVVTNSLAYSLRSNTKLSPLLEYGLDLTLPIGAVPIAMSREQLQYVEKTSTVISTALESLLDDIVATFSTIFDDQPSLWEASKALAKAAPENMMTSRARMLLAHAKYRGEPLKTMLNVSWGSNAQVWKIDALKGSKRSTVGATKWTDLGPYINPHHYGTVIIDDLPVSPKSKTLPRIRAFVEDMMSDEDTIVLRPWSPDKVGQLLTGIGGPVDYYRTSDMAVPEKVERDKVTGVAKVRPRVRMFRFDGTEERTGYYRRRIDNLTLSDRKPGVVEIPYDRQPASGILVTMTGFDLPQVDQFYKNMSSGLIEYSEIVFVNSGDAVKIKDQFVDFFVEHDKRLKAALKNYPQLPARLAVESNHLLKPWFNEWIKLRKSVKPGRKAFGKIGAVYEKYVAPLDDAQRSLAPYVTPAMPKGVDPRQLVENFETQQADAVLLMEVLDLTRSEHLTLLLKHL